MNIANFLTEVKDYRKKRGQRYNTVSILRLVLSGLLTGANSLASIHRWSKTLRKKELIELGFYQGKLLSYSNLTIILRKIDCDDLTKVMHNFTGNKVRSILHVDGKYLKGSNAFGNKSKKQILTAFNANSGTTTAHQEIVKGNESEAMLNLLKNAISRAQLLQRMPHSLIKKLWKKL